MSNPFEQIDNRLTNIESLLLSMSGKQPELQTVEKPISGSEICEFLDITPPTLIKYRNKGKIPFKRIGSKVVYIKSDVLAAIEGKKRG